MKTCILMIGDTTRDEDYSLVNCGVLSAQGGVAAKLFDRSFHFGVVRLRSRNVLYIDVN